MMEHVESNPLLIECQNCKEEDCYNYDNTGKRWYLPAAEEELRIRRQGTIQSIDHLEKQVEDIDRELYWLKVEQLYSSHDFVQFKEYLHSQPQFFRERLAEMAAELDNPNSEVRKSQDALWEKLKSKLVENFGEEWVAKNCKD